MHLLVHSVTNTRFHMAFQICRVLLCNIYQMPVYSSGFLRENLWQQFCEFNIVQTKFVYTLFITQ